MGDGNSSNGTGAATNPREDTEGRDDGKRLPSGTACAAATLTVAIHATIHNHPNALRRQSIGHLAVDAAYQISLKRRACA